MYSVYQHWDPLRVCAVGRSYPPEFYSWITVPHVRKLFEKIEDRLAIVLDPDPKKLEKFKALKKAYDHYKLMEKLIGEEE